MDADHAGRAVIALFILFLTTWSGVYLWWKGKQVPSWLRVVGGGVLVIGGMVAVFFLMADDEVAWCFRTNHPSCGAPTGP